MLKKLVSTLLAAVICFSLCACGNQAKVNITLKNGTQKSMTISELNDWKAEYSGRKAAEFEEMIGEATVSGTGKVVSVKVEEAYSKSGSTRRGNRFPCTVTLDNGIILDITLVYGSRGYGYDNPDYNYPGDIPEVDIYEGDTLSFTGTIYHDCISKDTLEVRIKTSEIGEFEKKVGLNYIKDITLN